MDKPKLQVSFFFCLIGFMTFKKIVMFLLLTWGFVNAKHRQQFGSDLLRTDSLGGDSLLRQLWDHQDAILCCSLKVINF